VDREGFEPSRPSWDFNHGCALTPVLDVGEIERTCRMVTGIGSSHPTRQFEDVSRSRALSEI
jgi:hypothetical protein